MKAQSEKVKVEGNVQVAVSLPADFHCTQMNQQRVRRLRFREFSLLTHSSCAIRPVFQRRADSRKSGLSHQDGGEWLALQRRGENKDENEARQQAEIERKVEQGRKALLTSCPCMSHCHSGAPWRAITSVHLSAGATRCVEQSISPPSGSLPSHAQVMRRSQQEHSQQCLQVSGPHRGRGSVIYRSIKSSTFFPVI